MGLSNAAAIVALLTVLAAAALASSSSSVSVLDFGAVAGDNRTATAFQNSDALRAAFEHVATLPAPRTVVIPAGLEFFAFNTTLYNVTDTTLQLQGTWTAVLDIKHWPNDTARLKTDLLHLENSVNFTLTGGGEFNGQGYDWWWANIIGVEPHRPHLVNMISCENTLIYDIRLRNSPQFHLRLQDMLNLVVHGVTIRVDVEAQRGMLARSGRLTRLPAGPGDANGLGIHIPTFPLNTDGIDPSGRNVHIYNCSIENFDDAVAVKPANGGFRLAQCSENMLIENMTVTYGVGMSIGSVSPSLQFNCVRNIHFRNVVFTDPLKAIYIKTDPGDEGYGIISDITYENIHMKNPVWWNIYIGPQQQKQPDGGGPGCMVYPLKENCPTQPRVPIYNVTLRNVVSTGGLLSPGIIRCNDTKPCTGFVFDNVNVGGTDWPHHGYICENVEGTVVNSTPNPGCFVPAHLSAAAMTARRRESLTELEPSTPTDFLSTSST